MSAVQEALAISQVSKSINTAFVERHKGTDRNRIGQKMRKTYCFSKGAIPFCVSRKPLFCGLRPRSDDWLQVIPLDGMFKVWASGLLAIAEFRLAVWH